MQVTLNVNGHKHQLEVSDNSLLVDVLRTELGLTGTHVGCDTSQCGACVVHVDDRSVKSCTMLAAQAEGVKITTIEGIAEGENLHPYATGVPQLSWIAMRLLHPRHDLERH